MPTAGTPSRTPSPNHARYSSADIGRTVTEAQSPPTGAAIADVRKDAGQRRGDDRPGGYVLFMVSL